MLPAMADFLWSLVFIAVFGVIIVYNLRSGVKFADIAMSAGEQTIVDLLNMNIRGVLKPGRKRFWKGMRVVVTNRRLFVIIADVDAFVEYEIELVDSDDKQPQRSGRFFLSNRRKAKIIEGELVVRVHGDFVDNHLSVPTSLSFATPGAVDLLEAIQSAP